MSDLVLPASPVRIRRTRGWRMPPGAVYVAAPSKWANPIAWTSYPTRSGRYADGEMRDEPLRISDANRRRWAMIDFRAAVLDGTGRFKDYPSLNQIRAELAGKHLVCWCPLDQPCHADVLLEIANPGIVSPSAAFTGAGAQR